jgi:tRNA pseudouridine38-40 synthase
MDSEMKKQRYCIRIAYDGTLYHGWQAQPGYKTVAGTLQKTFEKVFGRSVSILGASRTDTGVHAFDQVAMFACDLSIRPEALLQAWNNKLPDSIVIRSLEPVGPHWNPHVDVHAKTYWYHLFTQRPLPFVEKHGWFYRYPFDQEKLKDCLKIFEGTHDFRSFCSLEESEFENAKKDTVRRIDRADLEYSEQFSCPRVAIVGPRFLRYMVRRIVGACVDVAARKDVPVDYLVEILAARNPEHTLPKAPAKGLMLASIEYKKGEHDEN